jgi:hypothetical protein
MSGAPAPSSDKQNSVPISISESETPKPGLKARAIATGKKTLIMMFYLWLFLAVLTLHKMVILQQQNIDYNGLGFAIINAVILVKVMLVADDLNVGTRFRGKSLIYHALYASFWLAAILTGFHILEGVLMAFLHGRPLATSLADFGAGDLRGVLSISAIAFVAFIPFFLFREIGRVVGEDALWSLVFRRGHRKYELMARE